MHAEENKRRTLQRSDIATAVSKSDMYDFLIDIVPRDLELLKTTGMKNKGEVKKSMYFLIVRKCIHPMNRMGILILGPCLLSKAHHKNTRHISNCLMKRFNNTIYNSYNILEHLLTILLTFRLALRPLIVDK
jgi:hypothetical protein